MPLGVKKIGEKAPDESWREAYARHLPSVVREDADEQPRDEKGQFAGNGGGALVSAAHAAFRKNTTETHAAYANASPRQFGSDHPSMTEHSAYGKAQTALASRPMSPQERVAEYEKTHAEEKQAFDKYMAVSKTSGALSSADNPIHQLARDRESRGAPDTRMLKYHPDVQQARAAHEFAASRERQAEDRRVIEARAKNFPGEKPGRVGVTTNSVTGLKEKPSETFEQHWARHQENAAAKAAVSPAARMKAEELTGQAREASDTAKRLLTNAKKMPGALTGGIGAHATAQIAAAHTAAATAHSIAADAHEDVGNKNQASKHRREAAQHVERAATPSVSSKAIR